MGTRKAEASRANGRNSQGPTSAEGKSRVRLNALKSGLFSRETVIPCAGESQADFNQLRDAVWDQFNPRDATTAMLADEVVNSYWRLLRARRCEAGEIRKRLETARYRLQFDRIARADSQKSSFIRHHIAGYTYRTGGEQLDRAIIDASIEDARVQLKTSAAGLEFLIVMIRSVETAVKVLGYIEPKRVALLVDVCGVEDDFVKHCMMLNQIAEAEMAKIKKDKKMYNTFELNKQVFLMGFDSEIRKLTRMTKLLEQLESAEDEAQLATLLLPTAEGADRVHRAEAAHERSFYRALDRLMVL
jgi:hypothetical protein